MPANMETAMLQVFLCKREYKLQAIHSVPFWLCDQKAANNNMKIDASWDFKPKHEIHVYLRLGGMIHIVIAQTTSIESALNV